MNIPHRYDINLYFIVSRFILEIGRHNQLLHTKRKHSLAKTFVLSAKLLGLVLDLFLIYKHIRFSLFRLFNPKTYPNFMNRKTALIVTHSVAHVIKHQITLINLFIGWCHCLLYYSYEFIEMENTANRVSRTRYSVTFNLNEK